MGELIEVDKTKTIFKNRQLSKRKTQEDSDKNDFDLYSEFCKFKPSNL
jgi:hypothetical protein